MMEGVIKMFRVKYYNIFIFRSFQKHTTREAQVEGNHFPLSSAVFNNALTPLPHTISCCVIQWKLIYKYLHVPVEELVEKFRVEIHGHFNPVKNLKKKGK